LTATANGTLQDITLRWKPEIALTVIMAANGYPNAYEKNTVIEGLTKAAAIDDVIVFHAGTKRADGKILATGGRVLGITAIGKTAKQAQEKAYSGVNAINWPQGFCRSDIGWRAIEREKQG
jgi:phosphoribosylamine--glycine ligase